MENLKLKKKYNCRLEMQYSLKLCNYADKISKIQNDA